MIETSNQWAGAVTGTTRRVRVRIPTRITDSNLEYGTVSATSEAAFSKKAEVVDGEFSDGGNYATGEINRWILGGNRDILTSGYEKQVGWVSGSRSGNDGSFSTAPVLSVGLSGVESLRAVTVQFPESEADGFGVDFTVTAKASGATLDSVTVTDNEDRRVLIPMTACGPDTITVTVSRWSLPGRRARVLEVYPGWAVDWDESRITELSVSKQCSLSAMTQPYGTASVTLDNSDKLFDPLDKNGLFQAIEEGQEFPVEMGVVEGDETEFVPIGSFYHHNRGWKMGDSGMTFRFDLVDLIGLLSDTEFAAPQTLPSTVGGWLEEILSQMGEQYADHWATDPASIASNSLSAAAEDVDGKSCVELIKLICQAAGCVGMARASDGYLLLRSGFSQGPGFTLDNLSEKPVFSANDYLRRIDFKYAGADDPVSFYGDESTKNTASVQNPFVASENDARNVAQRIFGAYGGNLISLSGRGDPAGELGDLVTVETANGPEVAGRMYKQSLRYSGGVLSGCGAEVLHAASNYSQSENRVVFTANGTFTVPENVSTITVLLVGGGAGGGWNYKTFFEKYSTPAAAIADGYGIQPLFYDNGGNASGYRDVYAYGFVSNSWWNVKNTNPNRTLDGGADGAGGKVLLQDISVEAGQTFTVVIGKGGTVIAGTIGDGSPTDSFPGTATTFGSYTSASGTVYPGGYIDMHTGDVYGKSGQKTAPANSGYGGVGYGAENCRAFVQHTNQKTTVQSPEPYDTGRVAVYQPVTPYAWDKTAHHVPLQSQSASVTGSGYTTVANGAARKKYVSGGAETPASGADGICIVYFDTDPEEET